MAVRQVTAPQTPEAVALEVFNGGLVRVPDTNNARGYTVRYQPLNAMRAALAAAVGTPPADHADLIARLRMALLMARSWINSHDSHCLSLVVPHDEDGPYSQCNCSLVERCAVIDRALSADALQAHAGEKS